MKLLTKELFDDSQHFWYQINLSQESNFGAVFDHDNKNIPQVVATIVDDLQGSGSSNHFWYFGNTTDTSILMIAHLNRKFYIQVNLKDFDLALNLITINNWKSLLQTQLEALNDTLAIFQ